MNDMRCARNEREIWFLHIHTNSRIWKWAQWAKLSIEWKRSKNSKPRQNILYPLFRCVATATALKFIHPLRKWSTKMYKHRNVMRQHWNETIFFYYDLTHFTSVNHTFLLVLLIQEEKKIRIILLIEQGGKGKLIVGEKTKTHWIKCSMRLTATDYTHTQKDLITFRCILKYNTTHTYL